MVRPRNLVFALRRSWRWLVEVVPGLRENLVLFAVEHSVVDIEGKSQIGCGVALS
jgi:hypothetical protein